MGSSRRRGPQVDVRPSSTQEVTEGLSQVGRKSRADGALGAKGRSSSQGRERTQMCDKSRERARRSLVTVMGSFIRVCRGQQSWERRDWGRFQREREGRTGKASGDDSQNSPGKQSRKIGQKQEEVGAGDMPLFKWVIKLCVCTCRRGSSGEQEAGAGGRGVPGWHLAPKQGGVAHSRIRYFQSQEEVEGCRHRCMAGSDGMLAGSNVNYAESSFLQKFQSLQNLNEVWDSRLMKRSSHPGQGGMGSCRDQED